jgi:hypothetical protein
VGSESPPVDADAFNAFEAAGWERTVAGYDLFFGFFGAVTSRAEYRAGDQLQLTVSVKLASGRKAV